MASGNVLGQFDVLSLPAVPPNAPVLIDKEYSNGRRRKMMKFGASRTSDSEIPLNFIVPDTYGGTTGFTFKIHWGIEGPPPDTGNVYWEIKGLKIAANSSDMSNLTYGTAANTTTAIPTVSDGTRISTVTVAKALFGTPAAGDCLELAIARRSASQSGDTSNAAALVYAITLLET